jgi:hypothetical protein
MDGLTRRWWAGAGGAADEGEAVVGAIALEELVEGRAHLVAAVGGGDGGDEVGEEAKRVGAAQERGVGGGAREAGHRAALVGEVPEREGGDGVAAGRQVIGGVEAAAGTAGAVGEAGADQERVEPREGVGEGDPPGHGGAVVDHLEDDEQQGGLVDAIGPTHARQARGPGRQIEVDHAAMRFAWRRGDGHRHGAVSVTLPKRIAPRAEGPGRRGWTARPVARRKAPQRGASR